MIDLNSSAGTSGLGLKRSGAKGFLAIVFSVVLLISIGLWVISIVPELMTPTISRKRASPLL